MPIKRLPVLRARFDSPRWRREFTHLQRVITAQDGVPDGLIPPPGQVFCGLIGYEAGFLSEGLAPVSEFAAAERKQGGTRTGTQATSRSCVAEAQEHLVCSQSGVEFRDRLLTLPAHTTPSVIGGFFSGERVPEPDAPLAPPPPHLAFTAHPGRDAYCAAVRRTQEYIRAGDLFQLNLAAEFRAPCPPHFDAEQTAAVLRTCNPAPYGGYLHTDDVFFTCASPELFLRVEADGRCQTRPIKGTAPLHAGAALLQSQKDRAENIMIVDLMRNDLSRVCVPGSVRVPELCALETFATLVHLVSTVEGRLSPSRTVQDLLQACLPPGSVSGAPKHRAAQRIAELEGRPRGYFCGAFGTIDADGSAEFCVAIRTLIVHDQAIIVQAGSGITLASDAQAEYDEVLLKAAPALRACGGFI